MSPPGTLARSPVHPLPELSTAVRHRGGRSWQRRDMRTLRPVLWRKKGVVQLGATPGSPQLTGLGDAECDLLLDLGAGVQVTEELAARRGVSGRAWNRLSRQVAAPLRLAEPLPHPALRPVPLDQNELTRIAVAALEPLGARAVGEIAVLTDWYVTDPVRTRPLLRADRTFLPLVLDDDGATVGPVVVPGRSACPTCLDLWRAEADPEWPILATQLRLFEAGRQDPVVVRLAAAAAVLALGGGEGQGWRISADGGISQFRVEPHPDCGCLAPGGANAFAV